MPKEYTHWVLAERMGRSSQTFIKQLTDKHRNLFYLGAVAPDTPYYYLSGKYQPEFRFAADSVHGRHERNPYRIIHDTLAAFPEGIPAPAMALLFGILAHITTDAVFHPLVYYFCGSIEEADTPEEKKKSTIRHYVFESSLDKLYMEEFFAENRGLYNRSFKKLEWEKDSFYKMLTLYLFPDQPEMESEVKSAVKEHGNLQKKFYNPFLYWLLKLANLFSKGKFSTYIALSYFTKSRLPFKDLSQPVTYKNPSTGEERKISVKRLEEEAVKRGSDLFNSLIDVLRGKAPLESLPELIGPSLDAGVPYNTPWEMKHFNLF